MTSSTTIDDLSQSISDRTQLSWGANILLFLRCMILTGALVGIPTLAIFWDHLPTTLSNSAIAFGSRPIEENFEHYPANISERPVVESQKTTEETPLEQQLQSLGVVRYQLEQWGNTGTLWRFSCEVQPIGSKHHYFSHFEAIDIDQSRAVQITLAKIQRLYD